MTLYRVHIDLKFKRLSLLFFIIAIFDDILLLLVEQINMCSKLQMHCLVSKEILRCITYHIMAFDTTLDTTNNRQLSLSSLIRNKTALKLVH